MEVAVEAAKAISDERHESGLGCKGVVAVLVDLRTGSVLDFIMGKNS